MTKRPVAARPIAGVPMFRPICGGQLTEDVLDVVVFLASDGARFMTGEGINATGGIYMG